MAKMSSPALSMREIEPKLRGIVDPYLLGVHLEIPTEDLEQFRANYPGNVAQQRIDVINYWLNNSKDITWEALARAVEEMGGHKNLVTTLKKLAKGSVASQQELSVTGKSKKTKRKLSKKSARKGKGVFRYSLAQSAIDTSMKGKLPSEEQLADETLKLMKSDFSILLTAVRQSLKKHEISVESLLGHLRTIEAIGPNFEPVDVRHSQPLKAVVACEFESLEEVFIALAPYCSWFNHLIIRNIMETFCEGDEDLERKWMKFQDKVKKYCERRVIDCSENQYGEDNDGSGARETVVMKVDRNWDTIRVDQLFHIRASVAKVLNIKPFNLYLRTVENGCIKMLFYVPNHAMSNISCTQSTEEALHSVGIISVIYGPESDTVPTSGKRRRLTATADYTVVPNLRLESEQPDGDSVGRYQYYNRCILPPIYRVLRSFMPERNSQPVVQNKSLSTFNLYDPGLIFFCPLTIGLLLASRLPPPINYGVVILTAIGTVLICTYFRARWSRMRRARIYQMLHIRTTH